MKRKLLYTLAFLFVTMQTFAQTYTYENLNRLKKVVYENGTTVTYTYDALGNRTKKKVTSNSVADEFTVSVTALPVQGGTVSGGGTYASGTVIELLATPNAGYEFVEWSDGVTANPRTVTVTSDKNFTAQFLATGFTTDYAQKVILYMRNNRVYEYGVPELTDISFNDRKQQMTVNKTNNQQDEYSVLLLDSIAFVDGENNNHEWVDLGLPSGTLWATCNVGANSPEEYGDYFAWGETEPKENYNESTYQLSNGTTSSLTKYCNDSNYGYNGFTDDFIELLPEDDAATTNWGSDWQMPSLEQIQELLDNTTQTWTTRGGVNGRLCTSSNGNSIFLPAAGCCYTNLMNAGVYGYYMSRSLFTSYSYLAYYLCFYSDNIYSSNSFRYFGQSVRPVRVQKKEEDHEYVDLGLPSGTLWATCNVGASNPEEPGDLYAWGETETKTEYSWSTYKWCDGDACNASNHTLTKYCDRGGYGPLDGKISIDPEDDVAHVKWGGKWHMPTKAQFQELFENCTAEWIKLSDNLHAYKFTAPNGNSITMPAAGEYSKSNFSSDDFYYWSSELNMRDNPANNHGTHCVAIEYDSNTMPGFVGLLRYCGYAVRPVLSDYTPIVHQVQAPTSYLSHNLVDLGLPSGTLWATCNLGASSPEGYGCYYAWGETTGSCEGKTSFKDQTYQYYNGSTYTKYNSTDNLIDLEKSDDAAFAKWGGEWRMPTWSEMSELKNTKYTTWEWTSVGGINGLRVTSVVKGFEGNSIFLPAGGEHDASKVNSLGDYGYYWSSHLDTDSETSSSACYLFVKSSGWGSGYTSRSMGRSVRPVVSLDDISQ